MFLLAVYVSLLITTIASLATAVSGEVLQGRGLSSCPSAVLINSTTITVDGNEIQRASFSCPDGGFFARADILSQPRNSLVSTSGHLRRNAAECKTPAPECQCGLQFGCSCPGSTLRAPDAGDCLTLINSLQVISQFVGPTFTLPTQGLELLQFQTCAIEWVNESRLTLEYCWDELGTLASMSNQNCLLPGVSTEGSCAGASGMWAMNMFRVDT